MNVKFYSKLFSQEWLIIQISKGGLVIAHCISLKMKVRVED